MQLNAFIMLITLMFKLRVSFFFNAAVMTSFAKKGISSDIRTSTNIRRPSLVTKL